jgi:hypothetical protein
MLSVPFVPDPLVLHLFAEESLEGFLGFCSDFQHFTGLQQLNETLQGEESKVLDVFVGYGIDGPRNDGSSFEVHEVGISVESIQQTDNGLQVDVIVLAQPASRSSYLKNSSLN